MYTTVITRTAGTAPPALVAAFMLLMILIVLGVAYPAVWSRKASRRKAAQEVLRQLLRRK